MLVLFYLYKSEPYPASTVLPSLIKSKLLEYSRDDTCHCYDQHHRPPFINEFIIYKLVSINSMTPYIEKSS